MNSIVILKLRLALDMLVSIMFLVLAMVKYRITYNTDSLILLLGITLGYAMFYRHAIDNIDLL